MSHVPGDEVDFRDIKFALFRPRGAKRGLGLLFVRALTPSHRVKCNADESEEREREGHFNFTSSCFVCLRRALAASVKSMSAGRSGKFWGASYPSSVKELSVSGVRSARRSVSWPSGASISPFFSPKEVEDFCQNKAYLKARTIAALCK